MIRRLTAVAVSSVALLVACGGSSRSTSEAAPTSAGTPAASTAAPAADGATTTVAGNGADRRVQLQVYRDCLTQHGVTLPSVPAGANPGGPPSTGDGAVPPSIDPNGQGGRGGNGGGAGGFGGGNLGSVLQDPANAEAVKSCASFAPQGGLGAGNGQRGQAQQAYQSCLKDHGVEVPTTVAGGPPVSIDRTAPGFAAANEVCQALLPQRGATTTTVAA